MTGSQAVLNTFHQWHREPSEVIRSQHPDGVGTAQKQASCEVVGSKAKIVGGGSYAGSGLGTQLTLPVQNFRYGARRDSSKPCYISHGRDCSGTARHLVPVSLKAASAANRPRRTVAYRKSISSFFLTAARPAAHRYGHRCCPNPVE